MAIITISRQVGSLSHEIAPGLAKKLGWTLIDKETTKEALKKYDIGDEIIEKYDEKKPGFKDSFSLDNEKYFNYFKLYLFQRAVESKGCVFLGRGGAFLLRDVPGVFRIRLVASEKSRIERITDRYDCDEKEAKKIIMQSDRERTGFHKYYYREDWNDPESYDITFNTDLFTTDMIGKMVESMVKAYLKEAYRAEGRRILEDKLTAQRVIIKILYEENLPVHLLEVNVSDGLAELTGTVEVESIIESCTQAASRVSGINSIDNKIVFVSQYPPII